jgi:MazG family protein
MVRFMLEEAYELAEAVEAEEVDHICEELGDVLFHVLFVARMQEECAAFTLADVCRAISEKMVRRHPHVFGSTQVADSGEVVRNWRRIKQTEKNHAARQSVLDGVPHGAPALMRALAVSEKAARARFDWDGVQGVLVKLEEELAELRAALRGGEPKQVAEEIGDVLFTLVNVARLAGHHPETALAASVRKFEQRFRRMEEAIVAAGRELTAVPQSEKDLIWDTVKSDDCDH